MKKYFAGLMVLLMIFMVGCGGKQETKQTETPFIGGTQGLLINMEEDSPPPEVTDGGNYPFDVVVKLENAGEKYVAKEDVTVTISGIDPEDFDKTLSELSKNPDEDLEETRKDSEGNILEGTITFVEFTNFNFLGTLSGTTPYTIRADVCYKYGTTVNSKLCVLEDLLDVDENSVCNPKGAKDVFNTGAPVHVTSFEESVRSSDKIGFNFKIEHSGNGNIYKPDTGCEAETRTDENKVWVEVDTGLSGLKCSGLSDGDDTSGYVILYGGDRLVQCTQEIEEPADFEKVVEINLGYDYEEDKTTGLLVKHILE